MSNECNEICDELIKTLELNVKKYKEKARSLTVDNAKMKALLEMISEPQDYRGASISWVESWWCKKAKETLEELEEK